MARESFIPNSDVEWSPRGIEGVANDFRFVNEVIRSVGFHAIYLQIWIRFAEKILFIKLDAFDLKRDEKERGNIGRFQRHINMRPHCLVKERYLKLDQIVCSWAFDHLFGTNGYGARRLRARRAQRSRQHSLRCRDDFSNGHWKKIERLL